MAGIEQKTLHDIFLEEKEKLDAVERERAKLKAPANKDMPAMRPPNELIDRCLGPELNDDQIITKAQNKAWSKFKQQEAKIQHSKDVDEKNKRREAEMQRAFKAKGKPQPAKEQKNKKAKLAKDWEKEETKKKRAALKASKPKTQNRDKGMER